MELLSEHRLVEVVLLNQENLTLSVQNMTVVPAGKRFPLPSHIALPLLRRLLINIVFIYLYLHISLSSLCLTISFAHTRVQTQILTLTHTESKEFLDAILSTLHSVYASMYIDFVNLWREEKPVDIMDFPRIFKEYKERVRASMTSIKY